MASLTSSLETINSGKRIVQPAEEGPSFLGGLSKLASQGLQAYNQNYQQNEQIQNKKVLNEIETKVTGLRAEAAAKIRQDPGSDPTIDLQFNDQYDVPASVVEQAKELSRVKRAVAQGRSAQTHMDLQLESFVQEMQQKYPEQSATIGQYMRQQGFDHYLWREQALQDASRLAGDKARVDGYQSVIKSAIEAGYGNFGMDNDQLYATGIRLNKAAAEAAAAKELAAEARAAASEGRSNSEFLKKQSEDALYGAANAQINAQLGGLMDYLGNAVRATDGDDKAYERVMGWTDEVNDLFDKTGRHYVQRLQAEGAPKWVVDSVQESINNYKKGAQDLFFGSSSRFQQRNRAYQNMQTEFGLSAEKALPFYMWAKRTMGPAFMEAVFDGTAINSLSPELKEKVKNELRNWDPTRPNEGMNLLAEIGALAKGNASLADLPEGKITGDHVRGLNASLRRYSEQIMDPEPDNPDEKKGFLGSLGNITIAALRLQPGTKDLKALDYALGAITNGRNLGVVTRLLKDQQYSQQALPVFLSTRQAAAQILEVTRTAGPTVQGQSIETKNGRFYVKVDSNRSVKGMATIGDEFGLGNINDAKWEAGAINPELQRQATIMNAAVDYLADTGKAVPELKGYDERDLRAHYMFGTALPVKEGAKPPPSLEQNMNRFEDEMKRLSDLVEKDMPFANPKGASIQPSEVSQFFKGQGWSSAAAAGITGNLVAESGLNTGAVGDGGKALSLAQWHPDRQAAAKKNGFDLSDPQSAMAFVQWELENTEKSTAEKLKNAKTAEEAADIFALHFLRPKGAETGVADNIHNIEGRRRYARQYSGD